VPRISRGRSRRGKPGRLPPPNHGRCPTGRDCRVGLTGRARPSFSSSACAKRPDAELGTRAIDECNPSSAHQPERSGSDPPVPRAGRNGGRARAPDAPARRRDRDLRPPVRLPLRMAPRSPERRAGLVVIMWVGLHSPPRRVAIALPPGAIIGMIVWLAVFGFALYLISG